MSRLSKLFRCATLVLWASLSTVSCSSDEGSVPTMPQWAVSFRWSAEPGVDLDSEPVKVIRATIESNTIASFLNVDYGYPGWQESSQSAVGIFARTPHPVTEGIGTAYLHIVPVHTPGDLVYVVCQDMSGVSRKIGGKYPLPNPSDPQETLQPIAVRIGAPSPELHTPSHIKPVISPQVTDIPGPPGRHQRPSRNVFSLPPFPSYSPSGQTYRNQCLPWAAIRWGGPQAPEPNRTENEPPEIHPFTPGWSE